MDLPASSNVTLLDLVPPSCAEACGLTSSSFQTCDYGICICTDDSASGLEGCISCLYAFSPTQDIYDAAQNIFADFEDTCSPASNFSLQIIPDYSPSSSSGGNQATDPVNPATSSIVPFTSQTTGVTVPSQTAQWAVNNKQVCRAVRRQSRTKSGSSGYSKKSQSASKIVVVVAIVLLSTLTIHAH